jgi:hypothetical protein
MSDEAASAVSPDPELLRVDQALERGDHPLAARLARELLTSDDPARRTAGEATLQRLKPDPVIVGVLLASAAVLLAITLHWFGHR